jgi:hypothetical protein
MNQKEIEMMSDEDLSIRQKNILIEISIIKDQIGETSFKKDIDFEWLNRAKKAKRYKGIEHQALNTEAAKRKKIRNLCIEKSKDRLFIDVALDILDHFTFKKIIDEANKRFDEYQKNNLGDK